MKRFTRKLLYFTAPIILIFFLLEFFLRSMPTSYSIKAAQMEESAGKIELLILGNSHAAFGLDPSQFSIPAFNLAHVSQSIYFDRRITNKYIEEMKRLKYVLISVDFHSLYFSDEDYRDLWIWYGYKVAAPHPLPILSQYSRAIGYQPKFTFEFLKRYFSKKYQHFKALDVEQGVDLDRPISNGYFAYKGISDLSAASQKSRAAEFNRAVSYKTEHAAVLEDLETFIGELKGRGITPILITLPCYVPYLAFLDKQVQQQDEKDIEYLRSKYNLQYWNYLTLPLPDEYFYNCDHLNGKGAAYISSLISHQLK